MKTMKIEWIGPERVLPNQGTMQEGDIRDIPETLARSLIESKMAIKAVSLKQVIKKEDS